MYQSVGAYCSNRDNFAGLSYIGIAKALDVSLPPALPGRWNTLPQTLISNPSLIKLPFVPDTGQLSFERKRGDQGRIIAPEISLTLTGQSDEIDDFLSEFIGIDLFVLVQLRASGHVRAFMKMRLEESNESGDEPAQFTGSRLSLKPISSQLFAWKGTMPIDDINPEPGTAFNSGFSSGFN